MLFGKSTSKHDVDYDPSYKVKEVTDYMEERYGRLYFPGHNLSLDETLIWSFGHIQMISKAARHGIKSCVISCAITAFVLKMIMYTGRTTYTSQGQPEEIGKTVLIVKKLCEKYEGLFRTIYIDTQLIY